MSQDQFTKLFKYMQKIDANLERHSEDSRRQHAEINGAIADLGGQIKDYHFG